MDSNSTNNFKHKIEIIKKAPEMFIPDISPKFAITFVCGMEHMSDKKDLDGFKDWLETKYTLSTELNWSALLEGLSIGSFGIPKKSSEDSEIDFIFKSLIDYLSMTCNSSHS